MRSSRASLNPRDRSWDRSRSVSYTHLDVYKRQRQKIDTRTAPAAGAASAAEEGEPPDVRAARSAVTAVASSELAAVAERTRRKIDAFTAGAAPVSYTHLDVYKRQAAGWAVRCQIDLPALHER